MVYPIQVTESDYVCLKDMYITLKEIGKIWIVSVQRILLICKFINFMVVLFKANKLINLLKFAYNFLREKVNFSLIHPTHINIHSF